MWNLSRGSQLGDREGLLLHVKGGSQQWGCVHQWMASPCRKLLPLEKKPDPKSLVSIWGQGGKMESWLHCFQQGPCQEGEHWSSSRMKLGCVWAGGGRGKIWCPFHTVLENQQSGVGMSETSAHHLFFARLLPATLLVFYVWIWFPPYLPITNLQFL